MIEPSILTWSVGMPIGPEAAQSKLQAPAIQSMSRIPKKLQM
jgi:hypothetical protein